MNHIVQTHEHHEGLAGQLRGGETTAYASTSALTSGTTESYIIDCAGFAKCWLWLRFTPVAGASLEVNVYPLSNADSDQVYASSVAEESVTLTTTAETFYHIELPQGKYKATFKATGANITNFHAHVDLFR